MDAVHSALRSKSAVVADFLVLFAAGVLSGLSFVLAAVAATALLVSFNAGRVYSHRSSLETQGVLWYPARVATPFALVVLFLGAAAGPLSVPTATVARFAGLAAGGLLAMRSLTWMVLASCRRRRMGLRRTLVVGSGDMARTVVGKLEAYPEVGLAPAGILSPDGQREQGVGIGTGALPADLPAIIRHARVSHVVLVPEGNHDVGVSECLELCDGLDVSFSLLPPLADLFLNPRLVTQVGGLPLLPLGRVARTRRTLPGKRLFDMSSAAVLLLVAAPVLLAAAAAVKFSDGGPLLYKQLRVGQGGRQFFMLKLRSMVVGADRMLLDLRDGNITDGLLFKVRNDPRVTPVGRIIRKLSIDELPQLWNVLRGDMSLVGPRPLPVDPEEFGALDGKRHSVPPGITGYWQIAGGTGLTYQEMVKLDMAYIQNWSLWLDLRLLMRTVPALLTRHRHGAC